MSDKGKGHKDGGSSSDKDQVRADKQSLTSTVEKRKRENDKEINKEEDSNEDTSDAPATSHSSDSKHENDGDDEDDVERKNRTKIRNTSSTYSNAKVEENDSKKQIEHITRQEPASSVSASAAVTVATSGKEEDDDEVDNDDDEEEEDDEYDDRIGENNGGAITSLKAKRSRIIRNSSESTDTEINEKRLFIVHSKKCDINQFKDFMMKYLNGVESLDIKVHRTNNQLRGFAFALFPSKELAAQAKIAIDGLEYPPESGKKIKAVFANEKDAGLLDLSASSADNELSANHPSARRRKQFSTTNSNIAVKVQAEKELKMELSKRIFIREPTDALEKSFQSVVLGASKPVKARKKAQFDSLSNRNAINKAVANSGNITHYSSLIMKKQKDDSISMDASGALLANLQVNENVGPIAAPVRSVDPFQNTANPNNAIPDHKVAASEPSMIQSTFTFPGQSFTQTPQMPYPIHHQPMPMYPPTHYPQYPPSNDPYYMAGGIPGQYQYPWPHPHANSIQHGVQPGYYPYFSHPQNSYFPYPSNMEQYANQQQPLLPSSPSSSSSSTTAAVSQASHHMQMGYHHSQPRASSKWKRSHSDINEDDDYYDEEVDDSQFSESMQDSVKEENEEDESRLFVTFTKPIPESILRVAFEQAAPGLVYVSRTPLKKYAFVKYSTAASAALALLRMHDATILGQKLRVSIAEPVASSSSSTPSYKSMSTGFPSYSSQSMVNEPSPRQSVKDSKVIAYLTQQVDNSAAVNPVSPSPSNSTNTDKEKI